MITQKCINFMEEDGEAELSSLCLAYIESTIEENPLLAADMLQDLSFEFDRLYQKAAAAFHLEMQQQRKKAMN